MGFRDCCPRVTDDGEVGRLHFKGETDELRVCPFHAMKWAAKGTDRMPDFTVTMKTSYNQEGTA